MALEVAMKKGTEFIERLTFQGFGPGAGLQSVSKYT